jgi:hypothetical protein
LAGRRMKLFADEGACPEVRLPKDLGLRGVPRTELAPSFFWITWMSFDKQLRAMARGTTLTVPAGLWYFGVDH